MGFSCGRLVSSRNTNFFSVHVARIGVVEGGTVTNVRSRSITITKAYPPLRTLSRHFYTGPAYLRIPSPLQ